jgi:hypothetical protein
MRRLPFVPTSAASETTKAFSTPEIFFQHPLANRSSKWRRKSYYPLFQCSTLLKQNLLLQTQALLFLLLRSNQRNSSLVLLLLLSPKRGFALRGLALPFEPLPLILISTLPLGSFALRCLALPLNSLPFLLFSTSPHSFSHGRFSLDLPFKCNPLSLLLLL